MDHGSKALICLVGAHCNAFELFELTKEILDEMPPFIDLQIYLHRFLSLWSLGYANHCSALVQVCYNPVAVKRLVRKHGPKFNVMDEWGYTGGIMSIARQQLETNQIS